jgi:hypothetical protein
MLQAITELFFKIVSGVTALIVVFGSLGAYIYFDRNPTELPSRALPLGIAIGGTLIAILSLSGKTPRERKDMKGSDWLLLIAMLVLPWLVAGVLRK